MCRHGNCLQKCNCLQQWHCLSEGNTNCQEVLRNQLEMCFPCFWSLLCRAILCSQADSLRLHVILHEWLAFYSTFFNIHWSGVLNSADMAGATWNCCSLGAFCVRHTTRHHVTSCRTTYVMCMCVELSPATCTFSRITGIFYVLQR